MSGNNMVRLPEVIVFAGPNGSGKSTITRMARIGGEYINADDIKRTTLCTDLEAAVKAEEQGYFVRGIYVLTSNVDINVARVHAREALGGHGVPEEKIRSRYDKALALVPRLVEICDILHIYDNTKEPFRIFKKRKSIYYRWNNQYWSNDEIEKLIYFRKNHILKWKIPQSSL